ncbi:MAG: alpha/beta hydrolase [Oscillospiraceae bacterium]|jgi:pimeloyl-ACP methyl ester carboxylesterase|nr:alpha/beta hydrolase [Oscillospiraceae bacterium]
MPIDLTAKIPLGGMAQKIHIVGRNTDNPILLSLHGGPGVPNRAGIVRQTELARHFTLVAWDQRGTGGSYWGAKAEDMTVQRLVEDARELCGYLCETLGKEKLFLLCGSWGTQLGTLLASQYPDRIAAYVGSGQTVNGVENERLSFAFAWNAAAAAGDQESLRRLQAVGPPVRGQYKGGFQGLMTQRGVMKKYGGYSQARQGRQKSFFASFALPMLRSGEYTPSDLYGTLKGYQFTLSTMWPSLTDYDFVRDCHTFSMPYYIFQGRHDHNTPSALVGAFYDVIEAPKKELIWFEHSGHSPMAEEPEKFVKELRRCLRNS